LVFAPTVSQKPVLTVLVQALFTIPAEQVVRDLFGVLEDTFIVKSDRVGVFLGVIPQAAIYTSRLEMADQ
jgi:hypothetical protein